MPEQTDNEDTSVRVAVRIRPQLAREKIDMCRTCTTVAAETKQISLGSDRMFTYDFVFDMDSQQNEIYDTIVRSLIEGCFDGYNATVFAYGQTGSGKTYTMGTGFEPGIKAEEEGIIPRAVHHLFAGIQERKEKAEAAKEPAPEFKIHAQFMELYNEEILDLFDAARDVEASRNKKSHIKIHEDAEGGIYVVGVTTRTVASEEECLQCLKGGALSRTTASTNMNTQSSRSHAIFTLHIKQQRVVKVNSDDQPEGQENEGMQEFETLMAKFHFVDLAGSERLKRTGATGDRAKEGISINCGLLALGNVISALGDPTKRATHVPYRDSKLTRLLQDSLGGNSRTLMIACCSPSDQDFMETLNTMRYANRARNIKNIVIANQDKTSRQLAALRQEIRLLQEELIEYKQGKRSMGADGVEEVNDLFHENTMLQTESTRMRQRIKAMQETIDAQSERIAILLTQQARLGLDKDEGNEKGDDDSNLTNMMQGYIVEIENLRAKLVESESMNSSLRKKTAVDSSPIRASSRTSVSPTHIPLSARSGSFHFDDGDYGDDVRVASVLSEAKKNVEHDQDKLTEYQAKRQSSKDSDEDSSLSKDVETSNEDGAVSNVDAEEKEGGEGRTERREGDHPEAEVESGETEEDEDDEDEDEDSSSSSGSEDEDEADGETKLQEELAEIACEINIKQRLIEELETSQRRLQTMKAHYEEKLESLHYRIKETENERDKVLANLGSMAESRTKEKAEKIKGEFEIKLKKLTAEKSRLQKASKEHTKLMRDKSQHERQMRSLQTDLGRMKETRVKLMKQIKEEQQKGRRQETENKREIQKIKKQSRQYETKVKKLEAQAKQREIVLKRKHEELQALRKTKKPMSDRVAGRVTTQRPNPSGGQRPDPITSRTVAARSLHRKDKTVAAPRKRERSNTSEYSSRAAKLKWNNVGKKILHIVSRRQTISMMEKDMDRFMHHRNRLGRQMEKAMIRHDTAKREGATEDIMGDLQSQIEGFKANIEYVQDEITECQNGIMQVMEGKDEIDSTDAAAIIDGCSLDEAKYLLEHFVTNAITIGFEKAQRESEVKELTAKLHQEEQTGFLQQQLLQHLISEQEGDLELELDGLFTREDAESSSSAESSRASSPTENEINGKLEVGSNRILHAPSNSLPPLSSTNGPSQPPPPHRSKAEKARRRTATKEDLLYAGLPSGRDTPLYPVEETEEPSEADQTIILPDRNANLKVEKIINDGTPSTTPPSSPPVRTKTENVFSRLTQNSSPAHVQKDRGSINPVTIKAQNVKAPLTCSFVAEGHSKAVLSVQATEDLLFSGSKDRTVKIWKLDRKQEISTLDGHPNNVSCVKYCEPLQLVFSVSTAYIRVWDMRNTTKCIKTLSSSGLLLDSNAAASSSRTLTLPQGENPISDIALNQTSTKLYAASGNLVRVWDLNSFNCTCKLSGGPSAAVMCVCVSSKVFKDVDLVLAGSKDHYVKLFEVPLCASGCLMPRANLEPPHYDGVQSMVTDGRLLFSGSRDRSIKKWNIIQKNQVKSITNAHKDWICALDFLPRRQCLISGCRTGFLKFWKVDDCSLIAEMKAHTSPINSIATNSSHIFTASSDRTVSVWRPQGPLEQPMENAGMR
ncbi:kinesin-like protein KIF21A isoform X3 [Apostichopus japonicus]|uniref:kinesin-like protein KIF21A isoform X3 n=1 Tax=Stichopus japonicus TaxID=307972 RepID=UPI003AB4051E